MGDEGTRGRGDGETTGIINPKSKIQNGIVWIDGVGDRADRRCGLDARMLPVVGIIDPHNNLFAIVNSHGDRWGKIGAKSNAVPQL